MYTYWVPERLRQGRLQRWLKKAISKPCLIFKNLKFWINDGVSTEFYIFVLGPPRSGTTLVKNVLRAHSKVCGVDDETHFFLRKNYVEFRDPDVPDHKMEDAIRRARTIPELFDEFARARKQETGASIFLEKTTVHALRLGYVLDHFPSGKAVLVVRDPRDCYRSAKNNLGVWNGLPSDDPLSAYIETWKRCVWAYFDHKESTRVHLVQYEDFCRDPDSGLERIMEFLEMDVESQQLNPSMYGRTRVSERQGLTRLGESISARTIGKWRETLNESEVERIERLVSEEMKKLGYSPVAA